MEDGAVSLTFDRTGEDDDEENKKKSCQTRIDKAEKTPKELQVRDDQVRKQNTDATCKLSCLDTAADKSDKIVNLHETTSLLQERDPDTHASIKSTSQPFVNNNELLGCNAITFIDKQSSKDGILLHPQISSQENVTITENNQSKTSDLATFSSNTSDNEILNLATVTPNIPGNVNCKETPSHQGQVPHTDDNQSQTSWYVSNSASVTSNTSKNEGVSNLAAVTENFCENEHPMKTSSTLDISQMEHTLESAFMSTNVSENVNYNNSPLHHEHALNTNNQSTKITHSSNSATSTSHPSEHKSTLNTTSFAANISENEHPLNSASLATNVSKNINGSNTTLLKFAAEVNLIEEAALEKLTSFPTAFDIRETLAFACVATEILPEAFNYPVVQHTVVGNVCNMYSVCDMEHCIKHIQTSERAFHACENCTYIDCTSCDNTYAEANLENYHQQASASSSQFSVENLNEHLSTLSGVEIGKEEFELLFREEALHRQQNKSNKKAVGKGKRQAKKKQKKPIYPEPVGNKNTIMASSIDELRLPSRTPKDSDIPEHLLCPVCMDLLHRAVCCQPCGHIFCDRCLRKLGKYSAKAHSTCICPICRTVISYCNKMFDISNEAKFLCPEDYSRRCQTDNSDPIHQSLPSSPSPVDLKKLSRILTFRRQQARGAPPPSLGYSCKQAALLALALLALKGAICLLIYFAHCYYNAVTPRLFGQVMERLFVYFTNFKSVGMPEKILVSNYAVLAVLISVFVIVIFRRFTTVRNS